MIKKFKQPYRSASPASRGKQPTDGGALGNVPAMKFQWDVRKIDMNGPWGWENVSVSELLSNIIPKLKDYETQTWGEIEGRRNHSVDLEICVKEAKRRATEIDLDEDSLFSLRLTGPNRIWGIKDVAILRILWWDPNHEVCPSQKKGT